MSDQKPRIEWIGEPPTAEMLRLWLDLHLPVSDEEISELLAEEEDAA